MALLKYSTAVEAFVPIQKAREIVVASTQPINNSKT